MAVPESSQLAARAAWTPAPGRDARSHASQPARHSDGYRHGLRQHVWWWVVGVVAAMLIVLRLLAPLLITTILNRKLAALPDYEGHVASVSLSLYRGAYQLHDVRFESRAGISPALTVACSELEIAMLWRRLVHGALVGSVVIVQPDVALSVVPAAPAAAPSAPGRPLPPAAASRAPAAMRQRSWQSLVESFFPIDMEEIQVARGSLVYRDPGKGVDVTLGDLSLAVANITNRASSSASGNRIAAFTAHGTTIGGGELRFGGDIDPFASVPQFSVQLALVHVDLTALDGLFVRYERIDVKKGSASIYIELHCDQGRLTGYLKPLFSDLSMFRIADVGKHGISAAKEAVLGSLAEVFKNHPRDRFAGEMPLMGELSQPSTSVWKTIVSIVRNAFIKALQPGFDPHQLRPGDLPPAQAAQPAQPALHQAETTPAPP